MIETPPPGPSLTDTLLSSLEWRCIGPHRGGRCVAVAGDVADRMTFYFGACAGGVWKTTDGGTYWRNVSDGFFGTAAIGALAVSPSDPNVIYAGTGEACIRNNVSHGDGVYKSTDAGRTWRNIGLRDSRHIGAIRIHPSNPDLVYVAALGHAFGPNEERGVFRSQDGGQTWERILHKSPGAGSNDLSMDPHNPRTLYATIWQTQRYPHTLESGGPESGLWRSTDGGDTWVDITRNAGLPQGVLGKLGVAVSPARSGRVWALVEAADGALFRSDDAGETWARLCEDSTLRTRPWYYIHVFADPQDPETCWVLNYKVWRSVDGGQTFASMPIPHGDNHGLWIDPSDPRRMIQGNDGGACVTFNGGQSWSSIYNQPTAQLYHVITDDQFPYRVYGSQQDNTAISLPSLSLTGPIGAQDWYVPGGGESGYIAIKPDDPNIVAASGPAGRKIFNDYMTLYDHRTRERRDITVWPELYGWGVGAETLKYRFQWTFPILFSPHDPNALYAASNYVHRSRDLGASWEVISPDLTRNDPSKLGPSGGPVTRDNTGAEVYCTIFALVESPLAAGVFWAGSDDGLVHVSRDGGATWSNVTPPAALLPEWALISIVEPSPHDPGTAYIAATRYKLDDLRPYLLKTTDFGASWSAISAGLPEHDFTRVIRADPARRQQLYAGTETGLYVSFDEGNAWHRLGGNLPVAPIYDLVIKGAEMVVATHGRSFWILDDLMPLRDVAARPTNIDAHLFQPRPTYRLRLGGRPLADDPHWGMIDYARADASLVSFASLRRADGSTAHELVDAGTNQVPGVHIAYYLRQAPVGDLRLEIVDPDGSSVRTFSSSAPAEVQGMQVPARAGLNHVVWNMRYPGATRVVADGGLDPWQREHGPLVLPGRYEVRLQVDGRALSQAFDILPDPRSGARADQLPAQLEMLRQVYAKLSATNALINRVSLLEEQASAWSRWTAGQPGEDRVAAAAERLLAELASLKAELIDVHWGDAQLYPGALHEKFNGLIEFLDSSDHAPAQQARQVFAALSQQLDGLVARYERIVRDQVGGLSAALESAGRPRVGEPTLEAGVR